MLNTIIIIIIISPSICNSVSTVFNPADKDADGGVDVDKDRDRAAKQRRNRRVHQATDDRGSVKIIVGATAALFLAKPDKDATTGLATAGPADDGASDSDDGDDYGDHAEHEVDERTFAAQVSEKQEQACLV
jgi:hypothetical protein